MLLLQVHHLVPALILGHIQRGIRSLEEFPQRITTFTDLRMIRQAIQACHLLAERPDQPALLLSLNLSTAVLESPRHLQELWHLLDTQPLPTQWRLQLEVVESSLQQPEEELMKTFDQLHRRGVLLAIDDFGTGYSSLSRLNRYPFHSLKVDMSFVKLLDALSQPSNRILEVIQAMADALGLHTTAEGVETEAQRQWLQKHGFQWGQGYLVARPLPLAALQTLLRGHPQPSSAALT